MILKIARELHKFEWEVLEYMPREELVRWVALHNIEEKERKRRATRTRHKHAGKSASKPARRRLQ